MNGDGQFCYCRSVCHFDQFLLLPDGRGESDDSSVAWVSSGRLDKLRTRVKLLGFGIAKQLQNRP